MNVEVSVCGCVDGARRCRTRILKGDFGTLKYG